MNFSYSLISNSFNSIIIVLYLFCAIPTVADIWKIVILLKFEIIIASYVMHNVYCDKFKFLRSLLLENLVYIDAYSLEYSFGCASLLYMVEYKFESSGLT